MLKHCFALLSAAAGLAALFAACADPYPAYGVVLWSADESKIATGSRVAALAHSQLKKTVQVMALDENQSAVGDPLSIEAWRLKEFDSNRAMREWATQNQETLKLFGRSLKLALVVRDEPAIRDNNIIYRLRDGEDFKILSRSDKEVDEGGLRGYWYQILTQTGTVGYVFSVKVKTWMLGEQAGDASALADPAIASLSEGSWRPEDFPFMISTGHYDLGYFKADAGFRLDETTKKLHLVTERDVMDFSYSAIEKRGKNLYELVGSNVQVSFRDESTIVVQYLKDQDVQTKIFVKMGDDIEALAAAERDRRAALLGRMGGASGTITSDNYGSITIGKDGRFSWNGFAGLQPGIIPAGVLSEGSISFDLYLNPELRQNYRGVVSFDFLDADGKSRVNFLFQLSNDGLQLEYLPDSLVKGREVKRSDSNPTVMFFGF